VVSVGVCDPRIEKNVPDKRINCVCDGGVTEQLTRRHRVGFRECEQNAIQSLAGIVELLSHRVVGMNLVKQAIPFEQFSTFAHAIQQTLGDRPALSSAMREFDIARRHIHESGKFRSELFGDISNGMWPIVDFEQP